MQALKKLVLGGVMGVRQMGSHAGPVPNATRYANYFPKPVEPTPEEAKKSLRKEVIGFLLLGPASAGLMVYDLIWGLEEHHDPVIPPYPWMRIRRLPGMPWGEDGLFEKKNHVAAEWPPAEGLPAEH